MITFRQKKALLPHEAVTLDRLRIEVGDGIAYLWIVDDNSGAVDADFLTEVSLAHEILEYDRNVRGVIWGAAAGQRFPEAFGTELLAVLDPGERLRLFRHLFSVVRGLYAFSKPELVLLNQAVSGAGTLLAMAADWRFISDREPGMSVEYAMPGVPLPESLCNMIGAASGGSIPDEFLRSGGSVYGRQLVNLGLVSEILPPENLLNKAELLMRRLIQNPPEFMAARKRHLRRDLLRGFDRDEGLNDTILSRITNDNERSFRLLALVR